MTSCAIPSVAAMRFASSISASVTAGDRPVTATIEGTPIASAASANRTALSTPPDSATTSRRCVRSCSMTFARRDRRSPGTGTRKPLESGHRSTRKARRRAVGMSARRGGNRVDKADQSPYIHATHLGACVFLISGTDSSDFTFFSTQEEGMQIRNLGGCKRLLMAAAIASLIAAPLVAATGSPGTKGMKPGSGAGASVQAQTPDDAPRVGPAVLFPRSNYVWPFASGPIYGQVEPARASSAGVLHTRVGSFDLTRGMPNLPTELQKPNMLATLGSQYFLLQVHPEAFSNGAFDDMRGIVSAQGGAIVQEIPVGGFIV